MNVFLASNDWRWRLVRTIVQGVVGVFIANIDLIVGFAVLDPTMRALVMAVLSPIMAALGGDGGDVVIPKGGSNGA